MKPTLRLYGSIRKFAAPATELFLQKNDDLTLMVDISNPAFLIWNDEIPSKYKFLGNIVAVDGDHVTTDTGRTQVMHPDLLWQIEAAISEESLILKTDEQVWFGKPISRAKYGEDKRIQEAEEAFIRGKYGYKQLVAAPSKPSVAWEDDERVIGRKTRR